MREKIYQIGVAFILLLFLSVPLEIHAQSRISIDATHKYEGMEASFAKGYEPFIEKDTMILTVPFVSEVKMRGNHITVGIDFEREENSPFYYKTYQKQVKLSDTGVYLYQCRIKLRKDRINGQYPLHLWVEGKEVQEKEPVLRQEFTIYVQITDGLVPDTADGVGGLLGNDSKVEDGSKEPIDMPGQEGVLTPPSEDSSFEPSQNTEEKTSQPRLMVNRNSLQGQAIEAGSSVLWSLFIQNCSSREPVENVKVTLSSENRDLVFEKTAWYFEKVSAKNELDLSQNVTVIKKAAVESVQVQFQIEYEDSKGGNYTSTETLNLWINQPENAELASFSFPEKVYSSDTELMTFQIQNTGLATIYNAKIRLEGKGLFPQAELFLGNLEGGASLPGELQVFVGTLDMDAQGMLIEGGAEKYGDTVGTLVFSYENAQGEVTEQTQEIHTCILEPEIVELNVEKEKPKTNQWWITIVAGIMMLLILVIIWLYLRMKFYQRMRQ